MKARLFKRLKVINLLKKRSYDKNQFEKFHKLENRAELIKYHLDTQPIINRDIIV